MLPKTINNSQYSERIHEKTFIRCFYHPSNALINLITFFNKKLPYEPSIFCINIQQELNQYGLGIKIWDAYRPMETQQAFWDIVHDSRDVSHPTKGMRVHLKGVAVDVTLIDLKTDK